MTNKGDRIFDVRAQMRMTREEFAKLLCVTPNHVYMLEKGKRKPSLKIMEQIEAIEIELRKKLYQKVSASSECSEEVTRLKNDNLWLKDRISELTKSLDRLTAVNTELQQQLSAAQRAIPVRRTAPLATRPRG